MKLPVTPTGITSVGGLVDWLRTFAASLVAGWLVEHDGAGRHQWHWAAVPYAEGRFSANSSTWNVDPGDVVFYSYGILGDRMDLGFRIVDSDVGSGNAALRVALPDGYRVVGRAFGPLSYNNAGAGWGVGIVAATDGARFVQCFTMDFSNWTATTSDNTVVQGQIALRVRRD